RKVSAAEMDKHFHRLINQNIFQFEKE
ncbi:TetR/AcrR family transcriptional regulator, partial [Bacillus cereus]|nr:TetR/AcrR family transcriptional regulator [Bacillus cereus]